MSKHNNNTNNNQTQHIMQHTINRTNITSKQTNNINMSWKKTT